MSNSNRLGGPCLDTVIEEMERLAVEFAQARARLHAIRARSDQLYALRFEPQCHLPGCACSADYGQEAQTAP